MSAAIKPIAEWCAGFTELIGIGIIAAFAMYVLVYAATSLLKRRAPLDVFQNMRQRFGRGILLGLEFLVAADIIVTVAVDLSMQTVGTLALIVLIRTFLSFTLEVELTGKWPWQSGRD